MPVPQILELPGMPEILSPALAGQLSKVSYSSRYALALFYDVAEPKVQLSQVRPETGAHYITDDPIFCYAAIDSKKKELISADAPTSVVFHTKVPWGIKHLDRSLADIEQMLMEQVKQRYPAWPAPNSVKCLRWKYSQVFTPFDGCPRAVVLHEKPLLIAAGDGFMHKSGLDACIDSAWAATKILESRL